MKQEASKSLAWLRFTNSSSYEEVEEEHKRMVEEYDAIEYEMENDEDD